MEIDFALIQNRLTSKTFAITNKDGSNHNMSTSTVKMTVQKDLGPVDLVGVISGTDSSEVTFEFGPSVNADLGEFEYEIIEDPTTGADVSLGRGSIIWLTSTDFSTQIYTLIEGESKPFGITIDDNYRTQSVTYWKLYLQPGFNIPDEDLELDSAWPTLVRFLIAKLVVHSWLAGLLRGSLSGSFGAGAGSPGPLKKLETGPSNAEWHDGVKSLAELLKTGPDGKNAIDKLSADVCGLARRVQVSLPMCPPYNQVVLPIKGERPCRPFDPYSDVILLEYYGE